MDEVMLLELSRTMAKRLQGELNHPNTIELTLSREEGVLLLGLVEGVVEALEREGASVLKGH